MKSFLIFEFPEFEIKSLTYFLDCIGFEKSFRLLTSY